MNSQSEQQFTDGGERAGIFLTLAVMVLLMMSLLLGALNSMRGDAAFPSAEEAAQPAPRPAAAAPASATPTRAEPGPVGTPETYY